MKNKLSTLKLNIIICLFIWLMSAAYGILDSLNVGTPLTLTFMVLLSILSSFLLYKRYRPFIKESTVYEDRIECGDRQLFQGNVIKAFELNSAEKVLFSLISPDFDYSTGLLNKGLLIRARYDSYLIDNVDGTFVDYKKVRRISGKSYAALFYCALCFPILAMASSSYFKIDALVYVSVIIIFLFIVILRLFPAFYLGKSICASDLPLSGEELREFKHITIIEGFMLSDKLSIIPFQKPIRLDGLTIDILFRRYIVLNPRLFAWGSYDYLRFVLFHELCHVKHHDSSRVFFTALFFAVLDLIIPILPPLYGLAEKYFPYYDYVIGGACILYLLFVAIRKKKVEDRADRAGVSAIGKDGVDRVYEELNIDLTKIRQK